MRPGSGGYTAAHHAAHFIRQSHLVTRQNLMQQMRRGQFLPIVQAIVDTPATVENYQKLAEIAQDAQEHNLEPELLAAEIRETPFSWLIHILPENKDQAYSFIQMVSSIVALIISLVALNQKPQDPITLTPDQEKQIIKQLEECIKNAPTKPIQTDSPIDRHPPSC